MTRKILVCLSLVLSVGLNGCSTGPQSLKSSPVDRVPEQMELRREIKAGKTMTTFLAHYPRFKDISPFYQAVNAKLRECCEKECASFLSENPPPTAGPDFAGEQEIAISYCNENVVSASVYWEEFTGGAHLLAGSFGLNFAASNGQAREIELTNLFLAGSGWEEALSADCIAELREQGASSVVGGEVSRFFPNRLAFTISDSGLKFHFSPYDAGSYAEGFFWVDVPWSALRDYVAPNGPITQITDTPGQASSAASTNLLRVVIVPATDEVHIKETFKMGLRVENPTTTNQTVCVMNCSWRDEWKTSNTNISWIDWDCPKNFPVNVRIQPGLAYTNQLEMFIPESVPKNCLSFRMGFTPIGSRTTIWSDAVTIKIK